jgi:hypothetical protein
MSVGQPICFACKRVASIFDRNLGEWVCEGNADCGVSRNVKRMTPPQKKIYDALVEDEGEVNRE